MRRLTPAPGQLQRLSHLPSAMAQPNSRWILGMGSQPCSQLPGTIYMTWHHIPVDWHQFGNSPGHAANHGRTLPHIPEAGNLHARQGLAANWTRESPIYQHAHSMPHHNRRAHSAYLGHPDSAQGACTTGMHSVSPTEVHFSKIWMEM